MLLVALNFDDLVNHNLQVVLNDSIDQNESSNKCASTSGSTSRDTFGHQIDMQQLRLTSARWARCIYMCSIYKACEKSSWDPGPRFLLIFKLIEACVQLSYLGGQLVFLMLSTWAAHGSCPGPPLFRFKCGPGAVGWQPLPSGLLIRSIWLTWPHVVLSLAQIGCPLAQLEACLQQCVRPPGTFRLT